MPGIQGATGHSVEALSRLIVPNDFLSSTRKLWLSNGEKSKCLWCIIKLASSEEELLAALLIGGLALGVVGCRGNNAFMNAICSRVIIELRLSVISLLFLIVVRNVHFRHFIRSGNKLIHDWLTVVTSLS